MCTHKICRASFSPLHKTLSDSFILSILSLSLFAKAVAVAGAVVLWCFGAVAVAIAIALCEHGVNCERGTARIV